MPKNKNQPMILKERDVPFITLLLSPERHHRHARRSAASPQWCVCAGGGFEERVARSDGGMGAHGKRDMCHPLSF